VTSQYNIPGWNTYVREKHDVARDAYRSWVSDGKPKYGYAFDCMKRTRAVFKLIHDLLFLPISTIESGVS